MTVMYPSTLPYPAPCGAGPGLAVRVLGDVTEGDALDVLRAVDEVFINTIREYGLYDKIWQAFAVFLPVRCAATSAFRPITLCHDVTGARACSGNSVCVFLGVLMMTSVYNSWSLPTGMTTVR